MKLSLLSPDNDPMGAAIMDYYLHGKAGGKLRVFSSQFDEDEIPVAHLFRSFSHMSPLEQTALQCAEGHILDVGAGSGCHALALQEMGKEVTAIDISPLSVEVMSQRGVKEARQMNFFDESFVGSFDTLLLLMNGSGVIGKLENITAFFHRVRQLLRPGGSLYMDSSDLRYLFEEEDGSFWVDLNDDYYGEVDYRMQYKAVKGEPFDWLYIDFPLLQMYASQHGFTAELVQEGEHYDYLARLTYPA